MIFKVSFHGHETKSAEIANIRLKAWEMSDLEQAPIITLVKIHQNRFYNDTKDKTYRALIRTLSNNNIQIEEYINLLVADRFGNRKHDKGYLYTKELVYLKQKLLGLELSTITIKRLAIDKIYLIRIGCDHNKIDEILNHLTLVVQAKPKRNNILFLSKFIQKNYLEKNDDRHKGILDW